MCFSCCLLTLVLSVDIPERALAPFSLNLPFRYLCPLMRPPWVFSRLNSPSSLRLSSDRNAPGPSSFWWTFFALPLQYGHISLILLSRGAGSLPWLAAALLMQARVPLAFFAARAHYWFMCSLVTTRSFPASCFPAMWPTVCGCSFPGAGFYTSLRWTSSSSEGWYC